ncbi:MAG: YicC/YloC family endoribonuclease [Oligosphaeraceae bacterium]
MQSMTGYGRGVASGECGSLTVEITAVNSRKQVDLRCSLPRELASWEQPIRRRVQSLLSRGSLCLGVSYQLNPQFLAEMPRVDEAAFKAAARELRALAADAGLDAGPTVGDVLAVPGVLSTSAQNEFLAPFEALLNPALEEALTGLQEARLEEGLRLKADLLRRGQEMSRRLEAIVARGDEALLQLQERLRARLQELGAKISESDERMAKEMVFFAERADITEEVVRLKSHLVKYFRLLEEKEPGRELDFLGQEMNREVTTLSSKTADLVIAEDALALKIELSKVREQIMNIE